MITIKSLHRVAGFCRFEASVVGYVLRMKLRRNGLLETKKAPQMALCVFSNIRHFHSKPLSRGHFVDT